MGAGSPELYIPLSPAPDPGGQRENRVDSVRAYEIASYSI
jgi:hypothetical protein